jgi:hypothetical protein
MPGIDEEVLGRQTALLPVSHRFARFVGVAEVIGDKPATGPSVQMGKGHSPGHAYRIVRASVVTKPVGSLPYFCEVLPLSATAIGPHEIGHVQ